MFYWHRLLIAAVVVVIAFVLARVVDKALSRKVMAPEAATRYRVVRRHLDTLLSPTRSVIHPDGQTALVQTLRTLQLYTQVPATPATTPAGAAGSASLSDAERAEPDAVLLWLLAQISRSTLSLTTAMVS